MRLNEQCRWLGLMVGTVLVVLWREPVGPTAVFLLLLVVDSLTVGALVLHSTSKCLLKGRMGGHICTTIPVLWHVELSYLVKCHCFVYAFADGCPPVEEIVAAIPGAVV